MSNKIKDLIDNPHNIYKNNMVYWNFLLNTYEGGKDYIGDASNNSTTIIAGSRELKSTEQSNLFKHKKERNEDYKARVRMSYYYNFSAPIIDIYTNHLLKKPIIADYANISATVERRKNNIDKMGSSIHEFRKELVDLAQIYGQIHVVVDSPRAEGRVLTLKDQIDNDMFPYMVIYHPQDVINWASDSFGKLYWVIVREQLDGNLNPFEYAEEKSKNVQYRMWTRQAWYIFDCDGNLKETGIHSLGVVPMSTIYSKRSKKYKSMAGISTIADIAFIARDVYNTCSELGQIIRDQTFSILAVQGNGSDFNETEVGTNRGLVYPEGTNQPAYISPDSGNAETLFKHITNQVSAMFRLAKLEGASASFEGSNAVQQSGVSKAYDFNETNQTLAEKAANMQDGEEKLWNIFARWEGKDFEGSTAYPEDFSIQSLFDDLDEAEKMAKVSLGKLVMIETKKAIIKKKFSRMPEEEIDKLVADMESSEGQGEGGKLTDRLPQLRNTSTKTA